MNNSTAAKYAAVSGVIVLFPFIARVMVGARSS
jgi:hypothetical protein